MPDTAYTVIVGAAPEVSGDAFYRQLIDGASLVIAADAAAEWCQRLGCRVDLAVGDFDSASPGAVERLRASGTETLEFPADKDHSDLALAVAEAQRRGGARLVLTAVSTARIDHTLAAFGDLVAAGPFATLQEPAFTALAISGPARRSLVDIASEGMTVSLLSPGGAQGVTTADLRWPLLDATLEPLSSRGISNVVSGSNPGVSVVSGSVFVVTLQGT